jgi:hypothetical protein
MPVDEKMDYFITQWPNEEPKMLDSIRFKAADEIDKLRKALKELSDVCKKLSEGEI